MTSSEDRPIIILALSPAQLQAAARRGLSRELSDSEVGAVLAHLKTFLQGQVDWDYLVKQCVEEVKPDFTKWIEKVDEAVWSMAGCSVNDLAGIDFWSLYAVNFTPAQAADAALINAGLSRLE